MTTRRTKVLAIATAALLAVGLPLAAQEGDEAEAPMGVIVTQVDPDGPAAAAGIERGDLILSIDGHTLASARELVQALAEAEGSEVTLSIRHGDETRDQVVAIERIWGQPRIGLAITGGAGASVDRLPRRGLRMPMAPERRGPPVPHRVRQAGSGRGGGRRRECGCERGGWNPATGSPPSAARRWMDLRVSSWRSSAATKPAPR